MVIRVIRGKVFLPWAGLFLSRSFVSFAVNSFFVTFRGSTFRLRSARAFTLVELLIGTALSGMVMAAVLSSYIFLGRSFARLTNQQTLETEARRTLGYFTRDAQMATGISGTPSATSVTLTIPAITGTTTAAYSYNSSTGTLTRTPAGGTALVLLRNITSSGGLAFKYYDNLGNDYTSATLSAGSYLSGITQLSLEFSTQTLVYQISSNRMIVRNKALLP